MNWLKNLFKRTPAPEQDFMPLVTEKEGTVEVIYDVEGSVWEVSRSGDLIYLAGEGGLVQAQFVRENFAEFARSLVKFAD